MDQKICQVLYKIEMAKFVGLLIFYSIEEHKQIIRPFDSLQWKLKRNLKEYECI